jgi:hypothetical protein
MKGGYVIKLVIYFLKMKNNAIFPQGNPSFTNK